MLSYFPARDVEEPVTKEFLRAEVSQVRLELAGLRAEMITESGVVRSEMAQEFRDVRSEMAQEFRDVRTELAAVRTDVAKGFTSATRWTVGAVVALIPVLLGATAYFS